MVSRLFFLLLTASFCTCHPVDRSDLNENCNDSNPSPSKTPVTVHRGPTTWYDIGQSLTDITLHIGGELGRLFRLLPPCHPECGPDSKMIYGRYLIGRK